MLVNLSEGRRDLNKCIDKYMTTSSFKKSSKMLISSSDKNKVKYEGNENV